MSRTTDADRRGLEEAVWLLIALMTPLFVNLWVEQLFEASKVWLLRTLVWVLAVVWVGDWMAGFRRRRLLSAIPSLVVVLGLVLSLSTLVSPNRYIATFGALDRAQGALTQASYLLLFLCVATQLDSQRSRRLLEAIVLTAVPICLLGLAQASGWQPLPVVSDSQSPITTTLGRANFTGAYLALLLPLTLAAALSVAGRWRRGVYGALVVLELAVIASTRARAAWVAAIAGVGVFMWLQTGVRRSRRARWLSASAGLTGLVGVLLLMLRRGIANGGSIAARWTIWQASGRLLWPRLWLGYGADTLDLYFPSVYPPQLVYYQGRGVVVDRAHNWLLDWSLSYGVVATIVFAGLVYVVLRAGWRRLALTKDETAAPSGEQGEHHLERWWVAACMASICAHLVGNLFLFDVAATAVLFWLLLAIVTAATAIRAEQAVSVPVPLRVRKVVVVVSVLFLTWAVWQSNARPLLADARALRGTRALSWGDHPAALAEYAAAVEQQPRRAEYHVALALTAAHLGDFRLAHDAMGAAIALRPTDPVVYVQLADIYAREALASSGTLEAAYGAYDRAIALAPTRALTYRQVADLALRSGDGAVAIAQARRAVDLDATDGIAFGILGWAQLEAGNLAEAEGAFQQAVKWEPGSADFHLGLATVYAEEGEFAGARLAIRRSLAIDPMYDPALALQSQLGDEQ